jgi:hypothetical protein
MVFETITPIPSEGDDHGSGLDCEDPDYLKSIRDGVCPVCDAPLEKSEELLASMILPCGSPVCDFVLRPHGRLSRTSH